MRLRLASAIFTTSPACCAVATAFMRVGKVVHGRRVERALRRLRSLREGVNCRAKSQHGCGEENRCIDAEAAELEDGKWPERGQCTLTRMELSKLNGGGGCSQAGAEATPAD